MRTIIALLFLALATACSNPRNTKLPQDLATMDTIKPSVEKLKPEERELLTGYIMRHTMGAAIGAAFGQKSEPIPEGITIGKAIDEQRAFLEKERAREAEEKAKKDRAIAAQKAFADQVAQALAIRLIGIKVTNEDQFGIGKRVNFLFEVENKGAKAITGIKGEAIFKDRFGDQLADGNLKFEETIEPGKTIKTTLGRSLNPFMAGDKKLVNSDASSITLQFTPSMVIFQDGSKVEAPAEI